ncbi:MAG: hypothetical protein U1E89_03090 [Burkholderiaceae bacterium]
MSLGLLGLVLSAGVLAQAPGMITILEGDALIVRGAGRVRAAEGVRLAVGDIVETGNGAFAQVEFADQSVLDLGPATRVMIGGSPRLKLDKTLYALAGWFKLTNARKDPAARGWEFRSPLLEFGLLPPVVVLQLKPAEVSLFAERGEVKLAERGAGAAAGVVGVKSGTFYRRAAGARGTAAASPSAAFVAEMPRAFRDSLPLRAERFKDREVAPRSAPDFAYADVEAWLKAESPWRKQFVERWRAKAREGAFRSALVTNLSHHPEWDPVLFPEKYLPKKPASAASGAAAVAARPAS